MTVAVPKIEVLIIPFASTLHPQEYWVPNVIGGHFAQMARLLVFAFSAAISLPLLAQNPSPTEPPQSKPPQDPIATVPKVLEEGSVKPDGFYAYDKETGNRIMVPGISLQEIQELLDRRDGLQKLRDKYSFENVTVDGVVSGDTAELQVQFKVRIDANGDNWSTVPLSLPGVYLLEPIAVAGAKDYHLQLAPLTTDTMSPLDSMGYLGNRVQIKVDEPKEITISGKFRTQVVDQAGQRTLNLQLPPAPTQVRLKIPDTGWDVKVDGRGQAIKVDTGDKDSTLLNVDSDGGNVILRWQRREEQAGPAQLLDVEGKWTIRWPSQTDRLRASLILNVKNNVRGAIEPFEIAIGEAAEVSLETFVVNPNLKLSRLPGTANRWQISPEGDLPRRTDQISVRLELDLRGGSATAMKPFQLPEVNVEGALLQRGEVNIRVPRPSRLRWLPSQTARPLPSDGIVSAEDRTYGFEYTRMPFELKLWTEDPQEQMSLSPRMKLSVGAQAADLLLTIQRNTSASGGQPIEIDIRQWQLLSVRTASGPLTGEAYHLEGSLLTIESDAFQQAGFRDATPIQLNFHVPLSNQILSAELPHFSESSRALVETAEIEVRAENGWMFFFDSDNSIDIDRNLTTSQTPEVVSLKVKPSNRVAKLVGNLIPPTQDVRVEAQLNAIASERQLDLTESLQIQVSAAPITSISALLMEGDRLDLWQVSLADGTPVALVTDAQGSKIVPQRPLTTGRHQLMMKRSFPIEPTIEGTQFSLPVVQLKMPGMVLNTEIPVQLSAADGLKLEAYSSESAVPLEKVELIDWPLQGLRVNVRKIPPQSNNYRIEKIWLQTFSGGEQTRERATLKVIQPPRRLRLPADMLPTDAKIYVTVGGKEVVAIRTKEQMLEFDIPDAVTTATIEVSVWMPTRNRRAIRILKPLLEPWGINAAEIYWQLILPPNEHALQLSAGAGTGMRWRWDDWRFHRVPRMDDATLAQWAGTTAETGRVVGNRYLVASVGGLELNAVTIERSLLWTLVACVILGLAIGWMYVPFFRHPVSVVTLSLLLGGCGVIWPDAILLIGQLAVVAMLFVIAMLVLRQIALRQPQRSALGPAPAFRTEGSTRRQAPTQPAIIEPSSQRGNDFSLQPAGDSRR